MASWRMGNHFSREYRLLLESQWWSHQRLKRLQQERLRQILIHASKYVPYYRDLLGKQLGDWDGHEPEDVLKLFPVISKQDLLKIPSRELVSIKAQAYDRIPYSTSGSTGEPFQFLVDRNLVGCKIARYLRELSAWGIEPGTPYIKVWGMGRVSTPGTENEQSLFTRHLLRRREVSAFELDENHALEVLREVQDRKYKVIEAYTSTAYFLSQVAREREMNFPDLSAIVVSGETLDVVQKELIKTSLGVPVINAYGSREFGRIAFSTRNQDELYYSMENFHAEYQAPSSNPTGNEKNLILTCFDNYTQPFIRYNTGDMVIPAGEETKPGERNLERWKQVTGRQTDQVILSNGKHLSIHFFTLFFEDYQEQVRQFQIQYTPPDRLEILIIPGNAYDESFSMALRLNLQNKIGAPLKIQIELVENIPVTGDGKRPLLKINRANQG